MTVVVDLDPKQPDLQKIRQAAASILKGNLVAFPTETVYGLGANALDRKAVERIFYAKGRPFQDPLIVHIYSLDMLKDVVQLIPEAAHLLMERFWPGPLTLVFKRGPAIPAEVSAGLDTVAVRMPSHPIALALIEHAGVPIAAPSANRFGHTSPTSAAHVLADLDGRIDLVIDGGESSVGVESTVLDMTQSPPVILRPGGITHEQLIEVLGSVVLRGGHSSPDQREPMPSPGMLSRHYAPHATLILIECENVEKACMHLVNEVNLLLQSGKSVGVLSVDEDVLYFEKLGVRLEKIGSSQKLFQVANRLYSAIRLLDEEKVDFIFARSYNSNGLGLAILDRLRRAATTIIKID